MAVRSVVHPDVWASLDPDAGRLSRRERTGVVAFVAGVVALLAVAVIGYLSGIAYPRVNGDMTAARGTPSTHELDVRVRLSNPGWVGQQISGVVIRSSTVRVLAARPSTFELLPGRTRTVRLHIEVTRCPSVPTDDPLPVAVVVSHWWGHQSRVLFSDHGNSGFAGVVGLACHGG